MIARSSLAIPIAERDNSARHQLGVTNMLNLGAKKEALARLEKAAGRQERLAEKTKQAAVELHELRSATATAVIQDVENLVNRLAHTPKSFDKTVSEFRVEVTRFQDVVERFEAEAGDVERISGGAAAGGVAAGVGVAALGPTAAMAVATTFGTASTGTAISALSGAAATNAALAWLGGGAAVAGGGGMAGGQAFLALAGPVGWALGGTVLVGAAGYTHVRNGKIAARATKEATRVEAEIRSLDRARQEIGHLDGLTHEHGDGARNQLDELHTAPDDYRKFSADQKEMLAALINNVQSLGKLLNKQVA